VIAWERRAGNRSVTVIANLSRNEILGYRLPQSTARFSRELVAGNAVEPGSSLTLAPLRLYVLQSD
jgi:hypothetical protein